MIMHPVEAAEPLLRRLALLSLIVLSSCTASPQPSESESGAGAAGGERLVQHYRGVKTVILPGGGRSQPVWTLMKRTLDPGPSRILEETFDIDPTGRFPTVMQDVTYDVDGTRCTFQEAEGTFSGEGSLEGQPWDWDAWSLSYELGDGSKVVSECRFQGEKLAIAQRVFAFGSSEATTISVELEPVSEKLWTTAADEVRVAELRRREELRTTKRIECFRGTSETLDPAGKAVGVVPVLASRLVDPQENRILKHVIRLDERGRRVTAESVVELRVVDQARVTVADATGVVRGGGTLSGRPWEWVRMTLETDVGGGARLVTTDDLGAAGFVSRAQVKGADGGSLLSLRETFRRVAPAEYVRELTRLFPGRPLPEGLIEFPVAKAELTRPPGGEDPDPPKEGTRRRKDRDEGAPSPRAEVPPKKDPNEGRREEFFQGTSDLVSPDGRRLARFPVLVHRLYDRKAGEVTHFTYRLDPAGSQVMKEARVDLMIRLDGTFRFKDASGLVAGEGTWEGKQWAWTREKSEGRFESGTRFVSEVRLSGTEMTARQDLFAHNGQRTHTVQDELHGIDRDAFDTALARLGQERYRFGTRSAPVSAAGRRSEFYVGTSDVTDPSGTVLLSYPALTRVVFDPDKDLITQQATIVDPTGRSLPTETFFDFRVGAEDTHTFTDRGRLVGSGRLAGPRWRWTGLTASATFEGGVRLDYAAGWTAAGMTATKKFVSPAGEATHTIVEQARRVERGEYLANLGRIFPNRSIESDESSFIRRETFYRGWSSTFRADGKKVREVPTLVHRTLDEKAGTILEVTYKIDPTKKTAPVTLSLQMKVDGNAFEIVADRKAMTGSGRLVGMPWRWTAWSTTTELPDRTRSESSVRIEGRTMTVETRIFRPEGDLVYRLEEQLEEVTADAWRVAIAETTERRK